MEMSFEDIDSNTRRTGDGSHNYLINQVGNEIKEYSAIEYTTFFRNINQLKALRKNSDYDNINITSDKSHSSISIASDVRNQLVKIFNV